MFFIFHFAFNFQYYLCGVCIIHTIELVNKSKTNTFIDARSAFKRRQCLAHHGAQSGLKLSELRTYCDVTLFLNFLFVSCVQSCSQYVICLFRLAHVFFYSGSLNNVRWMVITQVVI